MAAPTTVRVEATSTITTRLYWVANGSADVGIYRSTDGSVYTLVVTRTVSNSPFYDSGLTGATLYYYKLSDDSGATYSSVVTVVTHTCPNPSAANLDTSLPRITDFTEYEGKYQINIALEEIDGILGRTVRPGECLICPTNGAVVLDCAGGCTSFIIATSTDINSISISNCDGGDTDIQFVIPPSTTVGICGWPAGIGFSGDECNKGPITGGTLGRTIGVTEGPRGARPPGGGSQPGHSGTTGGGGGGGGTAGCSCVPSSGSVLTIQCCTGSCSMSCATTRRLDLTACGGKPPYSWTTTKGSLLGTTGSSVTLSAANSSVAGAASRTLENPDDGVCTGGADYTRKEYGCNDQLISSTVVSWSSPCCECSTGVPSPTSCSEPPNAGCGAGVVSFRCSTFTCDLRDAGMIAAGCVPCFSLIGGVVTVTDSLGTAVSKTLAG